MINPQNTRQIIGFTLVTACLLLVISLLVFIISFLIYKGGNTLSWEFLSSNPKHGMTEGGIFPAIFGTMLVTILSSLLATPLGIACAVYLHEYTKDTASMRFIRASIRNLAGIPSIVFGLFGLAIFVQGLGLGASVLASGLTLGILTLPIIITTTEESLRNVPISLKEGAAALGATKFETIMKVVLPECKTGIFTGVILSLSRAAGETAPILLTGVAFYKRYLPQAPSEEFMALPYHLYILTTQHHAIEQVRPLAFATALVLLALVFIMNLSVFLIRARYQKK
jgi:phosphate transport system permease protein